MSVRLSHIAIACPEIEKVAAQLEALSLFVSERHVVPTERVKAAMIPLGVSEHLRLELLEPVDPDSPISKFFGKHSHGGLHHLSFEVSRGSLGKWRDTLMARGIEVLPPGIREAARGRALFIHPRHMGGVLVELEEILPEGASEDL